MSELVKRSVACRRATGFFTGWLASLIVVFLVTSSQQVQAQSTKVISPTEHARRISVLTGEQIKAKRINDPVAGEVWIYELETVKTNVLKRLPQNQTIEVRGVIGKFLENKGRYEFRTDDGSVINVLGRFPKGGGYQSWVVQAYVRNLGNNKFELSEAKKWRPQPQGGGQVTPPQPPPGPDTPKPESVKSAWWQDPLILAGIALIGAAVVMFAVMSTRGKAEEKRRADEAQRSAVEAQRARDEASSLAAQQDALNRKSQDATVVSIKPTPSAPDQTVISVGSLKVVAGPHAGETFTLTLGENRVGRKRDGGNSIILERDPEVSGQHGSVIVSHGGPVLFKDSSSNGSLVNGQAVHHSQSPLESGAQIEVGGSKLELTLRGTGASAAAVAGGASAARAGDTVVASVASTPSAANGAAGSTMVGYNAALEIVDGPDSGKPLFTLTKKKITLGRSDADLLLSDQTVSSQHATLTVDGGRFLLADNGSTNGTRINDQPVDTTGRELQSGDRITLGRGQTVLVFHRYN